MELGAEDVTMRSTVASSSDSGPTDAVRWGNAADTGIGPPSGSGSA